MPSSNILLTSTSKRGGEEVEKKWGEEKRKERGVQEVGNGKQGEEERGAREAIAKRFTSY
eukprot:scaffold22492_cov138-Skeletonema_menzelii.AAC.23